MISLFICYKRQLTVWEAHRLLFFLFSRQTYTPFPKNSLTLYIVINDDIAAGITIMGMVASGPRRVMTTLDCPVCVRLWPWPLFLETAERAPPAAAKDATCFLESWPVGLWKKKKKHVMCRKDEGRWDRSRREPCAWNMNNASNLWHTYSCTVFYTHRIISNHMAWHQRITSFTKIAYMTWHDIWYIRLFRNGSYCCYYDFIGWFLHVVMMNDDDEIFVLPKSVFCTLS